MYRLAAELGLYDIGNVASDVSKVKKTKSEKDSILKKAISLVDGYPESTQREIQIALYHWHNGNPYVADIDKINAPVSDGLFVIINDPIFILQSNTQKRTVEGLLDAGFKFPDDLKETKKARYAWCIEHAETACSIVYPDSVVVKVSDSFEPVALRTYTHLNKKFNPDTQSHVDDIVINFRFN